VAADDDVIDVLFVGVLDDRLGRLADDRFGRHASPGFGHGFGRRFQHSLGALFGRRKPLVSASGTPGSRAIDRIHHVEDDDLGVVELFDGVIQGDIRWFGAVDRNEDTHTP